MVSLSLSTEEDQALVNANLELIRCMEAKIKAVIDGNGATTAF